MMMHEKHSCPIIVRYDESVILSGNIDLDKERILTWKDNERREKVLLDNRRECFLTPKTFCDRFQTML